MRRLARVQRVDFWIALAALVVTLLVGVLAGVIIGIAFSLIWLIAVPPIRTCPGSARPARHPGLP